MMTLLMTDGYKLSHHQQYPKGTEVVYSNFTARSNKHSPHVTHVVSFGQQMMLKLLLGNFESFFATPKDKILPGLKAEISLYLNKEYDVNHFEALHDLGYLPLEIKAIEEGELVPFKVPLLTIKNTHPDFSWLPNYLETFISMYLWKPMTSATTAYQYKKLLTLWAIKTDKENVGSVDYQAHDFSMRGLDGSDAAITSGMGHLTSFKGSDVLPLLLAARTMYNEKGFVCGSVPATEHSVMSAGSQEGELETFRRLIETYPSGVLSIVSDTWDLWKVLTEYLPALKDEIMARDGKIVIRPDSGDPADIVCGLNSSGVVAICYVDDKQKYEWKGVIELLWDTFGGTTNAQGYKVLDSHIGAIYGDSITLDVAENICKRLEAKGFASTNIIFGIGSFAYQYNTRDTLGFAMKATWAQINGEGVNLFKNPITDDGTKKSATGLLEVLKADGEYRLVENALPCQEKSGRMHTIFLNGKLENETSLESIRKNIRDSIARETGQSA